MKKHLLLLLLFGLSVTTLQTQSKPKVSPILDLLTEQKSFIAKLCGHEALETGKILKSRAWPAERRQASQFLFGELRKITGESHFQAYKSPNIHPLIDLLFAPLEGRNVYSIIPATRESNEYVVLGAHYDTELHCPGAIDNATGVCLVNSVGKMLYRLKTRNKHVILVFFDQEEEDLNGSAAFAEFLKEKEWDIHSVHCFDMVGWDHNQDYEVELEMPGPGLEKYYKKAAIELGIPYFTIDINASDHRSFRVRGFTTTGVNDAIGKGDISPYKDSPQDSFETINFKYLASSTFFVFQAIKALLIEKI